MDVQHQWSQRLLTPLPEAKLQAAVNADDPLWEKIETGMVKLGSLAHGEVNLNEIADLCLTLLETKTKDMRVLVQLVRCLQHPAKASPFTTALLLLERWIVQYWSVAWPGNQKQKQRLMLQMIKRFEGVLERVVEQASVGELATLSQALERMAVTWCETVPEQEAMLENLLTALRRGVSRRQEQAKANSVPAAVPAHVVSTFSSSASGGVNIDSADERVWRKTLLHVADLLVSQQPDMAVGYRLRRHAIWSAITATPMANADNKTQLASIAVDRVNEYKAAIGQADLALWQQIEQSLTLSPYWFVGHHLSAKVAQRLGYSAVASAIASELSVFLLRLPLLQDMMFSDGTRFLPEEVQGWLQHQNASSAAEDVRQDLSSEVLRCCKEQGLSVALALLDERIRHADPRERFYASVMLAELLAEEGMSTLAAMHCKQLLEESQQRGLEQWEPKLVRRLERVARYRG